MTYTKIEKADRINLFSLKTPHMRAFHSSWFAFFLCFFGWFGVAPLMPIIREELALTKPQIGNIIIASVAITVIARLFIGWLCDKIGPRISYTLLLVFGSLPVMLIGLSNSYESFLLFRLAIGVVGASFVITQYHTSVMFAPKVIGTANATTAGWGNLGGGVTQMVMPVIFALFVGLGYADSSAWRYAMVVPGAAMLLMGFVYYFYTQDTPGGNFSEVKRDDSSKKTKSKVSFWQACKSSNVWILFLVYGACFGVELTINNIAALYFMDSFQMDLKTAGLIASLFGLMNLFARTLGGFFGDKAGLKWGINGRIYFLGIVLLIEGLALMAFSQINILSLAIINLIVFSLFVQMSEGATFSVVPFVNKKALGVVSGIVGAGGNFGAVMAGFLFKSESLPYSQALFYLGIAVTAISFLAYLIKLPITADKETTELVSAKQVAKEVALEV